jgi:uroporphyrinogen decarboxylase
MLHCDGAIRRFIPDLIEAGFEILNPIEGHLRGMDPVELKRDFGSEMTFQGGVDVKTVLNQGTWKTCAAKCACASSRWARAAVMSWRRRTTSATISRFENMLAFFEAARELGWALPTVGDHDPI